MDKKEQEELRELRKLIFLTGYRGGMAHLASCFSCLEILYVLYLKGVLRYDPTDPYWPDRDRFILSKGHAGLAAYAVMQKAGLISIEQVQSYLTENSRIGGEICMRDSKWVEASTGALGHGLSMAVGIAMGLKMKQSSAKVYCILGDGECQEGTVWEAAFSAPAFHLDNLVAILDCNGLQKMESLEKTIGAARWRERWEAFRWNVVEADGHDTEILCQCLLDAGRNGVPTMVIARTVKGKGVSIMENNPNWHFKLPGKKELKVFQAELGIKDAELR